MNLSQITFSADLISDLYSDEFSPVTRNTAVVSVHLQ